MQSVYPLSFPRKKNCQKTLGTINKFELFYLFWKIMLD